jgi:UDP-glucose 4-epimerase
VDYYNDIWRNKIQVHTKMKVLVTGGNGFIGSNLIKKLLEKGHTVHSLDNLSTGLKSNEVEGCHYHYGDIESIEVMDKDIDIIFHLAALARIQPSFENPKESFKVNTIGTQEVLDFAREIGARVVYAGSSSKWHDPSQSPYATHKHLGEQLCKLYRKAYKMDVEICRFYNVYGPNEIVDGDYAAVIGIWRRQVRDGQPITIIGDGEQRRDFTHVDDIVDALHTVATCNLTHDDAWELGTGVNYSINEVYQMFKDKFGVEKVNLPNQPGNYRKTLRENDDSLLLLGWKPQDRLVPYIKSL